MKLRLLSVLVVLSVSGCRQATDNNPPESYPRVQPTSWYKYTATTSDETGFLAERRDQCTVLSDGGYQSGMGGVREISAVIGPRYFLAEDQGMLPVYDVDLGNWVALPLSRKTTIEPEPRISLGSHSTTKREVITNLGPELIRVDREDILATKLVIAFTDSTFNTNSSSTPQVTMRADTFWYSRKLQYWARMSSWTNRFGRITRTLYELTSYGLKY